MSRQPLYDTYSGKLEHVFAPWYTASASYVHSAIQEPRGNVLNAVYANSTKLLRYTDATAVNNTFTLSPTTLLTVAYGNGLTLLTTYTWSANWDNIWSTGSQIYSSYGPQDAQNPKGEYARSLNSIPNPVTATVTYELPFGRGKKFFSGVDRFVDEAIGGWEVNDEWIDQNGVPLSIQQTDLSATTYGTTGIGGTYQRPNLVGDVHAACQSGRPQGHLGVAYPGVVLTPFLDPLAFSPTLPYTYGNAPRMLLCRAPGYDNQNLAMYKDIRLSEKFTLQFRAEALNVFNTPEFGPPSLTLGGKRRSDRSADHKRHKTIASLSDRPHSDTSRLLSLVATALKPNKTLRFPCF